MAATRTRTTTKPRAISLSPNEIEDRISAFENTNAYLASLVRVLRPPSKLKLADWADKHRRLSSESSAESGHWVTDKAPYEREIMNAISDPWTPRVAVQKGAQLGITDSAILNPIGYHMDEDPCPILVVQPTIEMAETFSTDRLAPMLRDSPRLRDKVAERRSRDSENTLRRKSFKGGYVALGGANSPASLSGRPIRVALLDDVDRYPASAGTEGNPLQLAIARTSAFWNRKIVIVSSPGIKGASHIEREMAESTCEHWYLPCPHCETMQILSWKRMNLENLTHRCSSCAEESEKWQWLNGVGEWRAHRPFDRYGNKVTTRGFYISGLVNPWVEWDIFRDEYIRAMQADQEGDIEPLKAFNNTRLGLLHEETGQKVEIDLFKERREVYPAKADIPEGVLVLTAGVDVGDKFLHYEVVGWGRGRECWGIEYALVDGDPREPYVWELLDEAVYNRLFTTRDGKWMRVRKMAVDSNYASDFVYAYTKPRQPRAVSVRGEGGLGKPFIKGTGTLTKSNRAHLVTLGVDSGKEEIVNRLMVANAGAGFCHFPRSDHYDPETKTYDPVRGYDEEYFKGLTAERRIVKAKNGFRTYIWIKRLSQRNEPFDCRNYALGALVMPWVGIRLNEMNRDEYEPPDDKKKKPPSFGVQEQSAVNIHGEQKTGPQISNGFGAINRGIY
jgi:phage terminase large subunit GpA-like protein